MSSSPSRAPLPSSSPASSDAVPFAYGEVTPSGGGSLACIGSPAGAKTPTDPSSSANARLEAEVQARESGRQQGLSEARKKFDEQLVRERSAIAAAVAAFSQERSSYYRRIEEEAVRLALSIARKILHREAQVDPLLLLGVARVALDKIEGATEIKLVVHPQHAPEWRRQLAAQIDPKHLPEIVEDPAMPLEQCQLRTSLGTTQLGIELQLEEIEKGLMDLLAERPQGAP
jgi:flagellar assembly protein FliH